MISVLGSPGYSAYAASKTGVRVMASELSPRAIRVNVVSPGAARTPEAFAAFDKRISLTIPLGRLGEAEEIAKTVLFLASDDASEHSGRGNLRRWRLDGIAGRRADLSRIDGIGKITNPISAIWRKSHRHGAGRFHHRRANFARNAFECIEPWSRQARQHPWAWILTIDLLGETDMSKAAQIFLDIPISTDLSERSENSEFDAILLFCGIGIVAFLIAIATGVQGVWM